MGVKIIVTGATGYVGEGVLLTLLENPVISEVLMVNRRHSDLSHPKLKELIVSDFFQIGQSAVALTGYDACFYCAGISSLGMKENQYTLITYDTTMVFAEVLLKVSPHAVFCFVSGGHTDSSEKGKVMWARVKGRTENALMKLPFKAEYNFRPGGMLPAPGQKNVKGFYVFMAKAIRLFAPTLVLPIPVVAQAMINAVTKGCDRQILEVRDIRTLAAK